MMTAKMAVVTRISASVKPRCDLKPARLLFMADSLEDFVRVEEGITAGSGAPLVPTEVEAGPWGMRGWGREQGVCWRFGRDDQADHPGRQPLASSAPGGLRRPLL